MIPGGSHVRAKQSCHAAHLVSVVASVVEGTRKRCRFFDHGFPVLRERGLVDLAREDQDRTVRRGDQRSEPLFDSKLADAGDHGTPEGITGDPHEIQIVRYVIGQKIHETDHGGYKKGRNIIHELFGSFDLHILSPPGVSPLGCEGF